MGKFNKKTSEDSFENEEMASSVDWQLLMDNFQKLSVEEAMKSIMEKVVTSERVEFDQICLVLKHYLLLEDNKSYLNHFITYESNSYVDLVLDRFTSSSGSPNVQWMITEILKVLTSVCDLEQALCLLRSQKLQNLLCNSLFDLGVLEKLKLNVGIMTNTEVTTLTNLFEAVSNLCEVYPQLTSFVTPSHLNWMSEAILNSLKIHKEFVISIVRLIHLLAQQLDKNDVNNNEGSQALAKNLLDLFVGPKNFLFNSVNYLSINSLNYVPNNSPQTDLDFVQNNLTAKLYLIASFANVVISIESLGTSKNQTLLQVLKEYGKFMQFAVDIELKETKKPVDAKGSSSKEENANGDGVAEGEEVRLLIKKTENEIECKLIAVETLKLIASFFIKEDQELENDFEEIDSDNETDMDTEMTTQQQTTTESDISDIAHLISTMHNLNLMQLLIKTITVDDEMIFQETDKIPHILNSINLLRLESLDLYLMLASNSTTPNNISAPMISHLLQLLHLLAEKPNENLSSDIIERLGNAVHEIYTHLKTSARPLDHELKLQIIELIKKILLKFGTNNCDLCVKLARILVFMAIVERDTNLIAGAEIIECISGIVFEMTVASLNGGLMDQSKVETLVFNAELLDLVVDLFGEDCLKELEDRMQFKERIQMFSEQFYNKYKALAKNHKLKKDNCLIVKTVRDNLKSFVQYKMSK